ncbi:MAG TPA: DUF455 family protein [Rhabdochlamydiaceae bacterium]|nr:DUF455 family protein [Rhabdochlamydiaceae bacterium]
MEIRDWALQILSSDRLEDKLFCPEELTDYQPGPPVFWKEPVRPVGMGFHRHKTRDKLPKARQLHLPDNRAVCLHRFAGHELLAVEIMAYALLAFPEAPASFRRGIAHTLKEEQEHVRRYQKRMEEMGLLFGDLPLYKHFWAYVPYLTSPLKYVSLMSLTFEMANLDFAPYYGTLFAQNGDEVSSQLMQGIFIDEISHVSFGCRWLKNFKDPAVTNWEAWKDCLPPLMTPTRAKGPQFFPEHRRLAGIDEDWIELLKESK